MSSSRLPSPTASSFTISEEHSTLYESLEAIIKHSSSVSNDWIDTIADTNNPRVLNTPPYNDGSFHWVNKNNELLSMAFPAVLELDGKYTKVGPYFNLMGDRNAKKPTIPSLSKVKATFQLSPLTVLSAQDVPPDAIDISAKAMNTLQYLYSKDEENRNEHLDPSKLPTSTPFHRTDVDTDQFKFVVNTRPIFRNLPTHGNLTVRAMTLDELKSSKSNTLPRPAEMRQKTNSNLVEDVGESSHLDLNIRNFPDPERLYSSILGAADVSNSVIHIPNIRDGNGNLITPDQYETKLQHDSIVMVNVYLKVWILRPSTQTNTSSTYRNKEGNDYGTRVYQMILNSMQILPIIDIYQFIDTPSPEKRKDDDDDTHPRKKQKTTTKKNTSNKNTRNKPTAANTPPATHQMVMDTTH